MGACASQLFATRQALASVQVMRHRHEHMLRQTVPQAALHCEETEERPPLTGSGVGVHWPALWRQPCQWPQAGASGRRPDHGRGPPEDRHCVGLLGILQRACAVTRSRQLGFCCVFDASNSKVLG